MAFDANAVVLSKHLDTTEKRIKRELDKISVVAGGVSTAFRSVGLSGGQVKFYATTDKSGAVVGSFDIPEELFLDQAGTTVVENFTFSSLTYPDATNPYLEGKTVLVLAVKGDKATNPTVKYSFVDLAKLIDTYSTADNSINIYGYNINVNISSYAGNLLELKNDGLFVGSDDTKLDKVPTAISGHFAMWGASGVLVDSGHGVASDEDIAAMLIANFGAEAVNGGGE